MTAKLTQLQEGFCLSYLESGDATQAYRAHYNTAKMKDTTVWPAASKMLNKPKVAARIQELRAAVAEKAVVSEVLVLAEAARIGLSDIGNLFDDDNNLLDIKKMSAAARAAVAGIDIEEEKTEITNKDGVTTTTRSRVKKVKLWDKNSALEKLMKYLGSFEQDNKQRAGIFDKLPKADVERIVERLRALNRPGLAGATVSSSSNRFTH